MTDSPDFILARIAEVQSSIQLNDLYIQIAVAVLISSLALFVALYVLERIKGVFDSELMVSVEVVSFFVFIIAALACADLVYEGFTMQVTLDQLTAQYEAVYGPLPIR